MRVYNLILWLDIAIAVNTWRLIRRLVTGKDY